MKLYKLQLSILFTLFYTSVNSQDLYEYYESLWDHKDIEISVIRKKVDSIIGIYESNQENLRAIKITGEFSKKLYRARLYERAIEYTEYEISIYRKLGIENNEYAKALYKLGLLYSKIDKFEESLTCYQELITLNVDGYSTARAYCELGKYYRINGDFFRSDEYYIHGISGLETFGNKNVLLIKYLNHALVLLNINTPSSLDRAKKLLDKTNELFNQVPKYSLRDYRTFNNYFANFYSKEERYDFDKAKYYCNRNLDQAFRDNDSTFIHTSYTTLGLLYIDHKLKEKDSILFFLKNGLRYAREPEEKSVVYHQFSHFFLENNHYDEALNNIQKSLMESMDLSRNIDVLPELNDLKISNNQYHVLLALIQKSTILIKLYEEENNRKHIELALSNLLSADTLVDILIDVSKEEGSRLYWREKASEIYLKGILVCEILKEKEKAFYFSEKKKALLLIEDIIKNIDKSKLSETILELENDLEKQILDLENLISSNKNIDNVKSLENKRFTLKQQYQKQEDSLKAIFPAYYKDQETIEIVDLKNVQKTLDEDDIIISYITNQDEYYDSFSVVYATLISKTQTEIIRIGQLRTLENLVKAYRNQLSKPFETEQDRLIFQETASELYALLIPKDKIFMSLDQKHLLIIPDGTLQYIPFESLVVDKNTNRYLIEDNEISYAYSMSFLQHNATVKRSPSQDLVTFAPVSFHHDDLEDISNSSNEIEGINKSVVGDKYSNKEASKNNFLSNANDYKIIHLATHANFSDNLQIAFHDTNLEYHELYTSKNQAELVVLSACNTSLGEIAEGEGVMSLARGFFYAGANTVISSLWNANDKSTAQIMESFYSNLENGQTKSKALHNAKINYLKSASLSDASPHYWATFVLIGDSDTKLFPSNILLYGILFSLLLGLLITVLVFFLKKR
ncbi:CHAT domain-containing protein [uncultured Aquimarina sp.]|uniref:CHAT domain-containing protein n=1 Tax=uncultured Aquimarina sp. TaxID=575652 RepID=UPI0026289918|nr:CHAT domain-containing protein [uncultured Aquimarina sp.]